MEQYRWAVIILNTCFFCTKRNGSLLFYLSPLNTWIIISLRIRKYHCFPFFFRTQTYEFNLITRSSAILYFDRSKQFIEIQRQSLVSQTSRYHHYQIQMNYFHHSISLRSSQYKKQDYLLQLSIEFVSREV